MGNVNGKPLRFQRSQGFLLLGSDSSEDFQVQASARRDRNLKSVFRRRGPREGAVLPLAGGGKQEPVPVNPAGFQILQTSAFPAHNDPGAGNHRTEGMQTVNTVIVCDQAPFWFRRQINRADRPRVPGTGFRTWQPAVYTDPQSFPEHSGSSASHGRTDLQSGPGSYPHHTAGAHPPRWRWFCNPGLRKGSSRLSSFSTASGTQAERCVSRTAGASSHANGCLCRWHYKT